METSIILLPQEFLLQLLCQLPLNTLISSSTANSHFMRISRDPRIWRSLYMKFQFPSPHYSSACLWKTLFISSYKRLQSWQKSEYKKKIISKNRNNLDLEKQFVVALSSVHFCLFSPLSEMISMKNLLFERKEAPITMDSVVAAKITKKHLLLASKEGIVALYSLLNFALIKSFHVNREISSIDQVEDNIAIGLADGSLMLSQSTLQIHKEAISAIQMVNNFIITASHDCNVKKTCISNEISIVLFETSDPIISLLHDSEVLAIGTIAFELFLLKHSVVIRIQLDSIPTCIAANSTFFSVGLASGSIQVQFTHNWSGCVQARFRCEHHPRGTFSSSQ